MKMEAMNKMGTWTSTAHPDGAQPILCWWMYKLENNQDGVIKCDKARLLAKACKQKAGVHCEECMRPCLSRRLCEHCLPR
jgi:hypothetical protein